MDDLVFEGRNKVYGAYHLRRIYDRNMSRGMITGILLFLLGISTPNLITVIRGMLPQTMVESKPVEVVLTHFPEVEKPKPVPAPPTKSTPPPARDQIKFVPPVVRPDDEVSNDDPMPPTVDDLENKDISTVTQEGDDNGVDVSLTEPDAPVGDPVIAEPEEDKIFNYVAQMPSFPDGQMAMYEFIRKHMRYPAVAKDNRIEGQVIVQFVVSKEGDIINAKVVRSVGGGIDQEALRVVKSMPRWNPGKHNGKAVPVTFTLPIKFELLD